MAYSVVFSKKADRQLQKLDMATQRLIVASINKHLEGCDNPRAIGKALSGDRAGQWRYRIGTYRLLATIDDGKVTVYVFKVAHRRAVYDV
ncbi:MAG: type II toxin-antitoxin system RelE/ParE family toxin [Coriobacteriales bacterium]|jgi:mRNA interferase RelE/StbE|nr:type II toxin-antitoxin system RelE/ParE family toxin [Coriobacteriales bacterium]